MRISLFIAAIWLSVSSSFACLNTVATTYEGERVTTIDGSSWHRMQYALETRLAKEGAVNERILRDAKSFKDRNDYAVALLHLGRNAEAVTLLTALEAEQPGNYYIAANLGTAHELTGNDTEALRWINEGIRRNPNGHHGTEWLHAKILETKLAAKQEPGFFEHHSVLDLQPATARETILVGDQALSPAKVATALGYQLEERMKFVKPTDPVVAGLLYDYAVMEAVTSSMETAKNLLKMAGEYGFPTTKIASLRRDLNRRFITLFIEKYWPIGLPIVCVIGGIVFACKRGLGLYARSRRNLQKT